MNLLIYRDDTSTNKVDNFREAANTYAGFLSHCHEDHLDGLATFNLPVYCSDATKELILRLKTRNERANTQVTSTPRFAHLRSNLVALPMNTPTKILVGKVEVNVTLIEANHCPGSVMFLFETSTASVLVTGDIRAEPWVVNSFVNHPFLIPYASCKPLDCIYMDTTFAYRNNGCPPYLEIGPNGPNVEELLQLLERYPADTRFVFNKVGTLGYEQIWIRIWARSHEKVHIDQYHLQLYQSIMDYDSTARQLVLNCVTSDPEAARFHACSPPCREYLESSSYVVYLSPVVDFHPLDVKILQSIYPSHLKGFKLVPSASTSRLPVYTCWGLPAYRRYMLHNGEYFPLSLPFYYSRHSSYSEVTHLVNSFQPLQVYPCTTRVEYYKNGFKMQDLFGPHCRTTNNGFRHDREMLSQVHQEPIAKESPVPVHKESSESGNSSHGSILEMLCRNLTQATAPTAGDIHDRYDYRNVKYHSRRVPRLKRIAASRTLSVDPRLRARRTTTIVK